MIPEKEQLDIDIAELKKLCELTTRAIVEKGDDVTPIIHTVTYFKGEDDVEQRDFTSTMLPWNDANQKRRVLARAKKFVAALEATLVAFTLEAYVTEGIVGNNWMAPIGEKVDSLMILVHSPHRREMGTARFTKTKEGRTLGPMEWITLPPGPLEEFLT